MTSLESPRAPVLAVVSPKGGNGKTTTAVNMAVSLGQLAPSVLVDLDVSFGDVEYALRLHPLHRLDDVVRRVGENPSTDIDLLLTPYSSGLGVLCSPGNPVVADELSVEVAFQVVDRIVAMGRPVVFDTGAGIGDYVLGALDRATHTLLVSGTDVASVQAGRKLLDTMTQMGLDLGSVKLVVNRSNSRSGLTVSDVEAVLGLSASLRIPEAPRMAAAMNEGVPVAASGSVPHAAESYKLFAAELLGSVSRTEKNERTLTLVPEHRRRFLRGGKS